MSANHCFGPFLFTRLDVAQHAVELFVRHERTHLALRIKTFRDFEILGVLAHTFDDFVENLLLNV